MVPRSETRSRLILWLRFIGALALFAMWACDDHQQTETAMFEKAELHYRLGNYDDAITGYQAFLRQYPTSPLSSTVKMRMRTIHREVASVLDRPGMPRPIYHGSGLKGSSPSPDATSSEPEEEPDETGDEPASLP